MAYDEGLSARFRAALGQRAGLSEKRMMGGVCFLINGNMIGGADRTKEGVGRLMFRVGKENSAEGEARPGAIPMVQGGRVMSGFFFVEEATCDDDNLAGWIALAFGHASALAPKQPKGRKRPKRA
jgi:hypothetical protein